MSPVIEAAIRLCERYPGIGSLPVPSWVTAQLDAHERRRRLVLDIWALSDKTTAFAALWLARAYAVTSIRGTVEDGLRFFKRNLMQ